MRQQFDVGDIVEYNNLKGLVLESKPITERRFVERRILHVDEYRCRIQFFETKNSEWVRAKWLKHVSKINQ